MSASVPNNMFVSYNDWVQSKEYRRDLANRLELPFTDEGRQKVARWGPTTWGDSFDGLKYDGKATDMKVMERWKKFKNDRMYISIFRDGEVTELCRKMFGHISSIEHALDELASA